MSYMTAEEILPIVQRVFPEFRITFGYIGNYEGPGRDSRVWRFFLRVNEDHEVGKSKLYSTSVPVANPKEVSPGYIIRALVRHAGRRLSPSSNQIIQAL